MSRQMCHDCPFNPASNYFHRRGEWAEYCYKEMEEEGLPIDGSIAHGCHNREEPKSGTADEEIICIGHRDWLHGIKHEKE